MLDFPDDTEAGVTPEMVLDEADIMDPETVSYLSIGGYDVRAAYSAAPMARGIPRKTGIDWVSFL